MNTLNRVRRALRGSAVAVLVGGGAVLLLGAPAAAHGTGHHDVEIKQYMFMPMALDIEQGETITWTNQDTAAHDVTVTAGPVSFHSPLLAQGKSWSHTFSVPGSYSYICSVHPEMKATITVAASTPVSRPTSPSQPTVSTPSAARAVAQGGSTAGTSETGKKRSGAKAQPVAELSHPAVTKQTLVKAPQSSATLQPLILVVGAAVAVVMFCLLLMASRPLLVDDVEAPRSEPKHLEET